MAYVRRERGEYRWKEKGWVEGGEFVGSLPEGAGIRKDKEGHLTN